MSRCRRRRRECPPDLPWWLRRKSPGKQRRRLLAGAEFSSLSFSSSRAAFLHEKDTPLEGRLQLCLKRNLMDARDGAVIPATREGRSLQKRKENADSLPAAGRLVAVAPPFAENAQGRRNDNV